MLLVDDEEAIRDVLIYMISDLAVEVFEAEDGKKALKMLENDGFDLIISDINMPDVSGKELIKKVKVEDKKDIPFIFITGGVNNHIFEGEFSSYIYGTLEKPFDEEKVLKTIQKVIDER